MSKNTLMKMIFGAVVLMTFASCSQDELADGNGASLPEGKYPLQIGSVTLAAEVDGQPWTRVSESEDRQNSHWDNGDKIKVQIGNGTSGTYTYQDGSLIVAGGDAPAYWTSKTDNQTIRAWHTSSGSETVELGNQTNSLAYVLTAQTTANFDTQVLLSFAHALAKVRVTLQGNQAGDVTDVKIKTRTSCTLNADGTLTAGETENFIPMVKTTYEGKTCWEANVMPGHEIQQVELNKGAISPYISSLIPLAGKVNTIKLTVGKLTPAEPITITDDGEYSIYNNGDQTITINGSPTVTLNGITISNDAIPIRIIGGSPTLIILGHTTLTTTDDNAAGIQLEGENTNVQIRGNGTLIINNKNGAGIGSGKGGICGNIDISGITAIIDPNLGAGIGGGECGHCGDIKIENATLTIDQTAGAAAIGCGAPPYDKAVITTCGNIEIINSDITANAGNANAARPAAIGCCGVYNDNAKGSCGNITITLKSGQEKDDFLSKLTIFGNVEKVGLGGYDDTLGGKVGTITWKQADGTVIGTPTPPRDL